MQLLGGHEGHLRFLLLLLFGGSGSSGLAGGGLLLLFPRGIELDGLECLDARLVLCSGAMRTREP